MSSLGSPDEICVPYIRLVCEILYDQPRNAFRCRCHAYPESLANSGAELFFLYALSFGSLLDFQPMFVCPSGKDDFSSWVAQFRVSSQDVGQDQRVEVTYMRGYGMSSS